MHNGRNQVERKTSRRERPVSFDHDSNYLRRGREEQNGQVHTEQILLASGLFAEKCFALNGKL
jgi:hypothetical protein